MTGFVSSLVSAEARVEEFRGAARQIVERTGDRNSLIDLVAQSPLLRSPWGGRFDRTPWHKRDQFDHLTGTPWTIISLIANRLSGQPIQIGRLKKSGSRSLPFQKKFNLKSLPECYKQLQPDLEIITDHPILRAFNKPNDCMVSVNLWRAVFMGLEVTGDHYLWLDINPEGEYQIWPVPSHWMEPIHTNEKLFAAWRVGPMELGTAAKIIVPSKQIVPFRYVDPSDPFNCISPMQSMGRAVSIEHAMEIAAQQGFINGANPGLAIIVGKPPEFNGIVGQAQQDIVLTNAQRQELTSWLKQRYQGFMRNEEPLILDGLIRDVKRVTNTPKELDFSGSMPLIEQRLYQGWGVNPFSAGKAEVSSRAASAVADDHLIMNCLKPRNLFISQTLTRWIPPFFNESDDLIVFQTPPASEDQDWELNKNFGLYDRGAMDEDELRAAYGMTPREEHRHFISRNSQHSRRKANSLQPMYLDFYQWIGRWAINRWKDYKNSAVRAHERMHRRHSNAMTRRLQRALRPLFAEMGRRALRLSQDYDLRNRSPNRLTHLIWNAENAIEVILPVVQDSLERAIKDGFKYERHAEQAQKAMHRKDSQVPRPPSLVDTLQRRLDDALGKAGELARTVSSRLVRWIGRKVRDTIAAGVIALGSVADAVAKVHEKVAAKKVIDQVASSTAQDATTAALNSGRSSVINDAQSRGKVKILTWRTMRDEKVRKTHREADGQPMDDEGHFIVGGYHCRFPGDPTLPAKERCKCRCTMDAVYVEED